MGDQRHKTITATKHCTGCSACVAVCGLRHALTMQPDHEGFLYPQVNARRCNHCGKCYRRCPSAQLETGKQTLADLGAQAFAPRYLALSLKPDYKNLKDSATTGAAYRIAYAFIREGGSVCGCRFNYDKGEAEHVLATTLPELDAFCGSKYVQSNKHDVMAHIKAQLKSGRKVLFIGTPCEVAGLKQILTSAEQELLFTIDLICHGVPDPQSLKLYLKELSAQVGPVQHLNFRAERWADSLITASGPQGTFKAQGSNTHYYFAFMQYLNLRPSCYHCPYASLTRVGDLTLGDFWGVKSIIPDFPYPDEGVSAAIINSQKGIFLINTLHYHTRTVREVSAAQMQATNLSLRQPAPEHPEARALYYAERDRTSSVVASVNAVIARFGQRT